MKQTEKKISDFNWDDLPVETFPTRYHRFNDWAVIFYEDMALFDKPPLQVIEEDGISWGSYISKESALEDGVAEAKTNGQVKAVKLLHAIPTEDATDEPIIIEVKKHVLKKKQFAIFTLRRDQNGNVTDKLSSVPLATFSNLEDAEDAWSDENVEVRIDDAVIVHYVG